MAAPLTLCKPADPGGTNERFTWFEDKGFNNSVRYLLRDGGGNHLGVCPSERNARDVTDLLNFAQRAEAFFDKAEPLLVELRTHIEAARRSRMPKATLERADKAITDIWTEIARLRDPAPKAAPGPEPDAPEAA